MGSATPARVRVERGIYRQRNGKHAVCWRHAGRLRLRTVRFAVAEARCARPALIAATREGKLPLSPRLPFETGAGWWLERFEAKVAAGERHPRTLEAHRYQLDRHLLAPLGRRAIAAITVDDVAHLLEHLRTAGCSAKTAASALATLQTVMRFARRCGWIVADPVERLEHDERPPRAPGLRGGAAARESPPCAPTIRASGGALLAERTTSCGAAVAFVAAHLPDTSNPHRASLRSLPLAGGK